MGKRTGEYAGSKGPFKTLEEARAAKPAGGSRKLYAVQTPSGEIGWTWADGVGSALIHFCRGLGYTVTLHEKAATKEKVAGMLAQLSHEDRAALLAQLGNGAVPAAAPADKAPAEKPATKSKK
jgi:hypothetical protein